MPVRLNSSGGGSVTLDVPATASTFNAVIPANNGTLVTTGSTAAVSQTMLASGVAGNGPAFGAFASTATNTANNTYTKVVLASEEFDTNNCFDTGLSRFTPNVAGYYQFNGAIYGGGYTNQLVTIFKNGAEAKRGIFTGSASSLIVPTVSSMIYMNGTTDYVEMFWYQSSGVTVNLGTGSYLTYFNGFLARAA